jgi:ABC-type lipoprotein export system ATPase subunit
VLRQTGAPMTIETVEVGRHERLAALIATHNPDLAARMDRTVSDGKAVAVAPRSTSAI